MIPIEYVIDKKEIEKASTYLGQKEWCQFHGLKEWWIGCWECDHVHRKSTICPQLKVSWQGSWQEDEYYFRISTDRDWNPMYLGDLPGKLRIAERRYRAIRKGKPWVKRSHH